MSCTSCTTDKTGTPKGCQNNGTCASGGCNKLEVFDWLSNMTLPGHQKAFDHVEIRFKNGRKHYFKNTKNLALTIGQPVAVEAESGHDIGTITLKGELVKVQMKKKRVKVDSETVKQIYRIASQRDIDIWQEARNKEPDTQKKVRLIISRLGLKMKLSDVEYQGDGKKAIFYYTADERVDFRMLIREMAQTLNIRIEMKQVGSRQEAARLGGIGSCGRELCCSTWLTDFRGVNTNSARYQQLSLNPQKLSGQCGKLKCCLNYELDSYVDALKNFPKTDTWLQTKQGTAIFQKMDIFNGWLWYTYKDNPMNWHKLTAEQANEIIALNKDKKKPSSLEEYSEELIIEKPKEKLFENVVGQDSLTRFDRPKQKRRKKKRNSSNNSNNKNRQKNSQKPNSNTNKANAKTTHKQPQKQQKSKAQIENDKRANANNPNQKKKKTPSNQTKKRNNSRNKPNTKPQKDA
ncbi:MAG: regulatory iron-sulfur-containing complex subunit RicT [Flavobacteriaceae bacterium]